MVFIVFINVNGRVPSQKKHHYGVPQGSVLYPILFGLYTQPLPDIISKRKCNHHKFSDDTQLRKSSSQSDFHSLIHDIEQCVDSVGSWMTGIRLKLNNDKTETFLVGCRRRVSVSQDSHLKVGSKSVGVYIDVTLSMAKHTDHINRSAYLEIRRISSVCHLLSRKTTVQLVCSFVLSRLEYCNSLIIDITSDQMYRLQKYSKACSQSRFSQKQTWAVIVSWCFQPSQPQRVASGLANMNMLHHFSKKLHWLPVKERILFKITNLCLSFL